MTRRMRAAASEAGQPAASYESLVRMVYGWERGDHYLTERYALLYGRALGISPDELAAGPVPATTGDHPGPDPVSSGLAREGTSDGGKAARMPHARTSIRAEKRGLREQMRAAGLSYGEIAAEFSRRYHLRPRTAWREAYGWSLQEAADKVNAFRGDTGLDPGALCGMTAAHLSEHEGWPGYGPAPTGRRPSPYLLAVLAGIYSCPPGDLIDFADRKALPRTDLLVIDTYATVSNTSPGSGNSPPPGPVSSLLSVDCGRDGDDPVNRREFSIMALGALAGAAVPPPRVPATVSGDHVRALQAVAAKLWARDREVGGSALSRQAMGQYATARAMLDTGSYTSVTGSALRSVTAELAVCAGFAAHDAADQATARALLTEAVLLAADDPLLAARACSLLALQSSALAAADGGIGRAREALRFLDQAESAARHEPSPRLHAAIWMRRATASAPLGDQAMIRVSIARARRELDRGDHPADPPWTGYVTPAEVTAHDAMAMLRCGSPASAARLFRDVLADPGLAPRNRALYQAYLATSLASEGDQAQAISEGLSLLPVLEGPVRSARVVNQLLPVRRKAARGTEFAIRFDALAAVS